MVAAIRPVILTVPKCNLTVLKCNGRVLPRGLASDSRAFTQPKASRTMRPLITMTSLFVAAVSPAAVAQDQAPSGAPCGVRTEVVQNLADQFGETQREIGLVPQRDVIMELFASGDGQTWTLMLSFPDGNSCLFASGTDWGATGHAVLKPGSSRGS
jgi:hypothetical protein